MNLLIDIGNTRIKWKTQSNEIDSETKAFHYQLHNIVSELNNEITLLDCKPGNVYISNVAGDQIKSKVYQWVADSFGVEAKFATSTRERCGLKSAYNQADRLGIDRFLAMIGALPLSNQALVVVDCGTATTIDCINPANEFIGGLILPGLDLMSSSLSQNANALEYTYGSKNVSVFSTDTESAILSGSILATTSTIKNTVKKLGELSGCDVKCIVTGGNGATIMSHLDIQAEYQPDLVLKGLSAYFQAK